MIRQVQILPFIVSQHDSTTHKPNLDCKKGGQFHIPVPFSTYPFLTWRRYRASMHPSRQNPTPTHQPFLCGYIATGWGGLDQHGVGFRIE